MRPVLRRSAWALAAVLPVAGVLAAGQVVTGGAGAGTVAPAVVVPVPPAATTLVCPGPLRLITEADGEDVVYDPQFDPAPGGSDSGLRAVTAGADGAAGAGVLGPLGDAPAVELTAVGPAGAVTQAGAAGATVLRVQPVGDTPAWAAAAVATVTTQGDLRGLAAASCQTPGTDAWLVGGGTEIGTSARLVLQNPGATPATVTFELWGPTGAVEPAGSPEFLVPAGSERVVLLEGVAAEQRRIVVHLSTTGGAVTAYLQDSRVRGLVPGGVDLVVPGAAPATTQVVAGLTLAASTAEDADPAVVRLLAPAEATTARITLLGASGPLELPPVDLAAGEVVDIPLGGIEAGQYTAVVTAGRPVVAAVAVTRVSAADGPVERAWAAAREPGAAGPVAVPPGVAAALAVGVVPTSAETAIVTVEAIGADGAVLGTRELTVPAGTTTLLPVGSIPTDGSGTEVAGVVVRTTDPRVAWAVPLTRAIATGQLTSVLVPVPPPTGLPDVAVRF